MKKNLSKVLVLTLIFSMLIVSQSSIMYAMTVTDKKAGNFNANTGEGLSDDELLVRLGLSDAEKIERKDATDKMDKMYMTDSGTIVRIKENSQERIELEYIEDGSIDTLAFTNDGKTFINAKEVIITDDTGASIPNKMFDETLAVSPKAGYTIYYTNSCPYGTAKEYTYNYGTEKKANMKLSNKLGDLTVKLFISFLCGQFNVGGTVAETIFENIYYELKKTEPQTDALSYKAQIWTHKDYKSGYIPSLFTFVYKYKISLYPKINYAGTPEIVNTYKCKMTV